jgi:hypothetical protein
MGRVGDVDLLLGLRRKEAGAAQAALAALAGRMHQLVALRKEVLGEWRYELRLDGEPGTSAPALACLSKWFEEDRDRLWAYAVKRRRDIKPPGIIPHLYLIGLTTVAFREDERKLLEPPYRESGFALAPVVRGFSTMTFSAVRKA